ncbi:unnamed protein product [Microthlaspi erraticum]|uniref:Transposase-associated domain-containing protein n=1 Tax=Microthlaspi erraticum TaxID=1685480 RepID=A0A6D2HJ06_9BRAS|nr:unnamed protein product [Microthlaspi erraticum]
MGSLCRYKIKLYRTDPAYEKGASDFVRDVAAALGDVDMIVCPCIDCRNIDLHGRSVVVDHLVTRGMDESYKSRSDCHSKLSAIVSLFRLKTQNGWSDKSFNDLLETLPGMLPADNVLHTSLYEVKKFLKTFDMG